MSCVGRGLGPRAAGRTCTVSYNAPMGFSNVSLASGRDLVEVEVYTQFRAMELSKKNSLSKTNQLFL